VQRYVFAEAISTFLSGGSIELVSADATYVMDNASASRTLAEELTRQVHSWTRAERRTGRDYN